MNSNQASSSTQEENETEVSQYLNQVRRYYDEMNPLILKYVATAITDESLWQSFHTSFYFETKSTSALLISYFFS